MLTSMEPHQKGHMETIRDFGRFPKRNKALGRENTENEERYLEPQEKSNFSIKLLNYKESSGDSLYRRSMYTVWKRTSPPPSMTIFDAPNRETCVVRRLQTNTPMQALVLQNDPQFLEAAASLGNIMSAESSIMEGINIGFMRTLGRTAQENELRILSSSFKEYIKTFENKPENAVSLIRAGQSYNPKIKDPKTVAAWTLVASTLLNMDEFVTRQ